jgi:hypothetical protein
MRSCTTRRIDRRESGLAKFCAGGIGIERIASAILELRS